MKRHSVLLLVILFYFQFSNCVNVYQAIKNAGYTKFTSLLDLSGKNVSLSSESSCNKVHCYFVLVPTDDAINRKFASGVHGLTQMQAKAIVEQHYVGAYKVKDNNKPVKGTLSTFDNQEGLPNESGYDMWKVKVQISPRGSIYYMKTQTNPAQYYVNNAQIIVSLSNKDADNGIFHVINEVMSPTGTSDTLKNLINTPESSIAKELKISTSLKILQDMKTNDNAKSDLYNALISGFTSRTVFLPSNNAWAAVPETLLNDLTTNPSKYQQTFQILASHFIIDETIMSTWMSQSTKINVKSGHTDATFAMDGTISKNSLGKSFVTMGGVTATIITPNVPIADAVIHVIDHPLNYLYETLATITQKYRPSFYNLCLKDSECNAMLSSSTSNYTVFAPLDVSAIQSYTGNNLKNILMSHFISGRYTKNEMTDGKIFNSMRNGAIIRLIYKNSTVQAEGGEQGNGFVSSNLLVADYPATNGVFQGISQTMGIPTTTVMEFIRRSSETSMFYDYIKSGFTPDLELLSKIYTVFIPSNTAIQQMQNHKDANNVPVGQQILNKDTLRNRVFKRMIIDNLRVYLPTVSATSTFVTANSNENEVLVVGVQTSGNVKEYSISAVGVSVTVNLNRGLYGCTNGIVYVVDQILFRNQDVEGATTGACRHLMSCWTLLSSILLSLSISMHRLHVL